MRPLRPAARSAASGAARTSAGCSCRCCWAPAGPAGPCRHGDGGKEGPHSARQGGGASQQRHKHTSPGHTALLLFLCTIGQVRNALHWGPVRADQHATNITTTTSHTGACVQPGTNAHTTPNHRAIVHHPGVCVTHLASLHEAPVDDLPCVCVPGDDAIVKGGGRRKAGRQWRGPGQAPASGRAVDPGCPLACGGTHPHHPPLPLPPLPGNAHNRACTCTYAHTSMPAYMQHPH